MKREEALVLAEALVERLSEQSPIAPTGIPNRRYEEPKKPVSSLGEKVSQILRVAEFLTSEEATE